MREMAPASAAAVAWGVPTRSEPSSVIGPARASTGVSRSAGIGDPQGAGADGDSRPQHPVDAGRSGGHRQHPRPPGVPGPEGELEGGGVGGGQVGSAGIGSHLSGERVDLRAEVGRGQAGDHQRRLPVVAAGRRRARRRGPASHGGTPRPDRRRGRSR